MVKLLVERKGLGVVNFYGVFEVVVGVVVWEIGFNKDASAKRRRKIRIWEVEVIEVCI